MLRPDPIGAFDIAVGTLMYFTVSPVPELFATFHAGLLIFKGVGTMLKFNIFPIPLYYLFATADVISAGILLIGQPPMVGDYKEVLAAILFLKGGSAFLTFLS